MENCIGNKKHNEQSKYYDIDSIRSSGLNIPNSARCVTALLSDQSLKKIRSARIMEKMATKSTLMKVNSDNCKRIDKAIELIITYPWNSRQEK